MKIFYSWQSDLPNSTNRSFIRQCMNRAVNELKLDESISEAIRDEIHIDQDTQGVPGSPDIAKTILEKIDNSAFFVADITPIMTLEKGGRCKSIPNPNVMLELGYALSRLGSERVVLVLNGAFLTEDINSLPFDFRFRRIGVHYSLPENQEKNKKAEEKIKLVKLFVTALKPPINIAAEVQLSKPEFVRIDADEQERSIWKRKSPGILLTDYFDGVHDKRTTISGDPKSFIRIAPASWPNGLPRRATFMEEQNRVKLLPLGDAHNWNYGVNDDGYISYESTYNEYLYSATQWFNSNGEMWGFDAKACKVSASGSTYLNLGYVVKCWQRFFCHLAYYRELGAKGPFYVEAGLDNILGSKIYIDHHKELTCLETSTSYSGEIDGSPESVKHFLKSVVSETANLFGTTGEVLAPQLFIKK